MSECPNVSNDGSMPLSDRSPEPVRNSLVTQRLVRALHSAETSNATTIETRAAVCAFVDELKAQGLPPERALVQIKEVLGKAAGDPRSEEHQLFLQRVITWCIEAYYALPPSAEE